MPEESTNSTQSDAIRAGAEEQDRLKTARELAEHVRTVHFALLVLCLALFAISWRPLVDQERAIQDADSLAALSTPENEKKFEESIADAARKGLIYSHKSEQCIDTFDSEWVLLEGANTRPRE